MDIQKIKPLTSQQYEKCREVALELTKNRIGNKPIRKQFAREYSSLFGVLDILGFVIFAAALAISSMHILGYTGNEAQNTYELAMSNVLGIQIGDKLFGVIHQLGFIALSEAAMLLFFVTFRLADGWSKYVNLVLAIMAVVFVVIANLHSGFNPFLSLLAPVFTIGFGFRLEMIVTEIIKRRNEIDKKYQVALNEYELASKEPEKSPLFKQMLANEIWAKVVSLKANQEFVDADIDTKKQVVLKEMERENWSANLETNFTSQQPHIVQLPTQTNHWN